MAFAKRVWDQLRATKIEDFLSALERDGYTQDKASKGAVRVYLKKESAAHRRVVIHYHPNKTWGAKFLAGLIADAGWEEPDLVRLGLIDKPLHAKSALETKLVPCDCDGGMVGSNPCPLCGGTRFREIPLPPDV